MTTPSLGLVLPDRQPIEADRRHARLAEAAGFDTVWCYELTRDSQIRAVGVAQHTTSIRVGTCVSLWHSTPVSAAMRATEIQRWSEGRFHLGLGVGTEASNLDHHGTSYDRPVARMREYLEVVRSAWAASDETPLAHDGPNFTVRGYPGTDLEGLHAPPVLLAAMGPAMVRLAVRDADGIMLSPSATPKYVDEALRKPHRAELEAREAAGRPLRVVAVVRCSVDRDRRAAWERARRSIAWYGAVPAHARIAEQHGFGAEAAAISSAWERGDATRAAAAVSDAMVTAFSLVGTSDDVRSQLRRWDGVADSVALITPSEGTTPDEVAANVTGILDAFSFEDGTS